MSEKKRDARPQSEKFKDKAREIEADEDDASFEEKLKHIARQKPTKKGAGQ